MKIYSLVLPVNKTAAYLASQMKYKEEHKEFMLGGFAMKGDFEGTLLVYVGSCRQPFC